jgi:hypothetical protein
MFKNRERRDVDLISDVVDLGSWSDNHRSSFDDLVFPGENAHGFLSATVVLRRHLYPAMAAPGYSEWGRPKKSGRSTASGTPLQNARSRAVLRSRGSPDTSATPRSR